MIYDEAIGGLVITGKTYCIYINIKILLFIFHKVRKPKKFLRQRNTTKGVPLEN